MAKGPCPGMILFSVSIAYSTVSTALITLATLLSLSLSTKGTLVEEGVAHVFDIGTGARRPTRRRQCARAGYVGRSLLYH